MKRFPWSFLLALLAGLGLGLAYAWMISPLRLTDSEPSVLRVDFKDQFRSVIAASYAATGNLPRAEARLSLLGDPDPIEALNAQAQRTISSGDFEGADQLAALAADLEHGTNQPPQVFITSTFEDAKPLNVEVTVTPFPSPEGIPLQLTGMPEIFETQIVETQPVPNTPTPRPTRTPPPTQGAPFRLIAQDTVCDPNLPERLLQVIVFNSSRRQLPGIRIVITWDSGGEEFFTGLKPELGNGYADFVMFPDTSHAVQIALGSDIATDLVPPACRAPNGETYLGGYKLTFQQP
ncbi:MAG: hypothetical protein HUU11_01805 [Anaerolineales bacterium]|nr:hypothetical protein [Anaerolineales bacterium]